MKQVKPTAIRFSNDEKIGIMSNLATMLAAGIPILEAIDSLLDEAKGNQRKLLLILREDLEAGKMIHTTFAKFPRIFDQVTVNLIKAAEEAGNLEKTLKDVKENLIQQQEFNDKVKSAMMYPLFVTGVFGGVMLMILVVVLPKISQVFGRLNMELPIATRIMIGASDLIMTYSIHVGVGVLIFIGMFALLFRYQREKVLSVIYSLPIVSRLVRQIDLTRFTRSLHLLISSGMPIASALELAQDVISKKDLKDLVVAAKEQVIAGKTFSEGLKHHNKLVSGIIVKLIEVGERTGSLDDSLKDISKTLDYQVSKDLKSATAMLEPIMLVVVGVGVGLMMLAIIGPIYGLISDVSVR